MSKRSFASLGDWQKEVDSLGYVTERKHNDRLGDFYIAKYREVVAGSFCPRYPKDGFVLLPSDSKFK